MSLYLKRPPLPASRSFLACYLTAEHHVIPMGKLRVGKAEGACFFGCLGPRAAGVLWGLELLGIATPGMGLGVGAAAKWRGSR